MKITFVCTGNTCRSSMAEALARQWLKEHNIGETYLEVTSAGLAAYPGSPASEQAIEVLRLSGIDLTGHRAKGFSGETADNSDIIFTMTSSHKRAILERYPAVFGKVFTLAEYGGNGGKDVSDPYGQPTGVYFKCAMELRDLIDRALHMILRELKVK